MLLLRQCKLIKANFTVFDKMPKNKNKNKIKIGSYIILSVGRSRVQLCKSGAND